MKDELYAVMENPGVKWMLLDARNQQSTCCCWVGKFYPFQILVQDFLLVYICIYIYIYTVYIICQLWGLCRFVVRIYAFVVASVRLQFHVSATCCQVHTPSHISSNHQPAINPRVGWMFLGIYVANSRHMFCYPLVNVYSLRTGKSPSLVESGKSTISMFIFNILSDKKR